MANLYTGTVQGASKIATGTPSALCRAIIGGNYSVDLHMIEKMGIGSQVHVRKGTLEPTIELQCVGVEKTDLALWFPTSAGVQVGSFFDLLVEVDVAGTGQEWVLSDGQPSALKLGIPEGEDAELTATLTMKFATITPQAAGTNVPVYNSLKGHTINDSTVEYAASPYGTLSWELSHDLGAKLFNPQDGKTSGVKTFPDGVYYTVQKPRLAVVTSEVFKGASAIFGDTFTPEALSIALENGTGAEDITIAFTDFVPGGVWGMAVETENRVGFAHEFIPGSGTQHNRVTFS